jgi:hypothetical protein
LHVRVSVCLDVGLEKVTSDIRALEMRSSSFAPKRESRRTSTWSMNRSTYCRTRSTADMYCDVGGVRSCPRPRSERTAKPQVTKAVVQPSLVQYPHPSRCPTLSVDLNHCRAHCVFCSLRGLEFRLGEVFHHIDICVLGVPTVIPDGFPDGLATSGVVVCLDFCRLLPHFGDVIVAIRKIKASQCDKHYHCNVCI